MAEEDLIFGKKRHLFGGIEPSNMLRFVVTREDLTGSARLKIEAELPKDTVIDGQTLCTVKGAVIRRDTKNYPEDEFSGELVANITSSQTFYDTKADINGTYYYAAFPYTTQEVYNRNPINRAVFNEPLPMVSFTAVSVYIPDSGVVKVQLAATLPLGAAGAVIRRSTEGFPATENDGEEFMNITSSGTYEDTNVIIDTTYYYSAFPYTSTGAYNRSEQNRASCTPSHVVEDLDPMPVFEANSVYNAASGKATVQLQYALPDTAIGAVIRKSTTDYPETESSGEAVATVMNQNGTYTDENVDVGTKYYYAAFPFTSGGYNRNPENRTTCTPSKYLYLYGFDINLNDDNPDTRVSYPSDVDNSSYAKAKMTFGGSFSYGGWPSTPGEKFMPRPCMLTYAGTVDHYLNPNDYTKKTDNTASKVADTSFGGNAMMEWPKIYTKRWVSDDNVYHFRCSDVKMDSDWECWCNYDRQNNEIDHFYTPIYFGSNVSNRMRSISGTTNLVGQNAETEINYAKANGDDWYTEVLSDRLLIQDLLVMMAKSTDLQTAFGFGVVSGSTITPGTMNTNGLFWGSDDKKLGVKVFGMENWWGNLWRRTAGWILDSGGQKVKVTRGTKDGSKATDYNLDGANYITVADSTFVGSSGGYIRGMKTESYGRIPVTLSGSSSTCEADGAWHNNSGVMYAFVGGHYGRDLGAGPFCVGLYYSALPAYDYIGAALSCKPLAR